MASPFLTPHSLLPAFEDGTDTWFRNVGILYIDAGEKPKRKYTIFKSRRKLEIYKIQLAYKRKSWRGLVEMKMIFAFLER